MGCRKDFNLYDSKNVYKTIGEFFNYFNNEKLAYSQNYKIPDMQGSNQRLI